MSWLRSSSHHGFIRTLPFGGLVAFALLHAGCNLKDRSAPDLVWGVHGTGPGWLHKPRVAAFDAQNQLYIADLTDRIQVFDRDGQYLRGWRTPDFNVDGPSGLTVDRHGRLLVADTHFYRVLVYSRESELLFQIGDGVQGTTPGRFGYPTDVVIDSADNFYVAEYGENDRIQVFSPEGKWLRQWGGHGYEPGEFLRPRALVIDAHDQLYVADSCNHRIQVFDTQGKLLRMWGSRGAEPGQMSYPFDLAWDRTNASTSASLAIIGSRSFAVTARRWARGAVRARARRAEQPMGPGRRPKRRCLGDRYEQSPGATFPPVGPGILGGTVGDGRKSVDRVRPTLVADPDSAHLAAACVDELSQPRGTGQGAAGGGDLIAGGGDHAHCAGARRSSDRPPVGPALDTVRAGRVQQRAARAANGGARVCPGASRKRRKDDMAGLIVFGKSPRVEVPPAPAELTLPMGIESTIDPENTDPGAALKLGLAAFPEDTARRVVMISDGNENRGNLLEQTMAAKALGVQVDVVPIDYRYDREVLVEKVSIPPDVKKGETVNISVVIRASEPTRGTLQIFQKADNYRAPAAGNQKPVPVELQRGVNVFVLQQLIKEPNYYTFTAEFIPDKDSGDKRAINNVAEGFTHARGKAQVLLIEGTQGEHAELIKALREKEIEVKPLVAPRIDGSGGIGGDLLPTDIAQLQPYDAVILANVPKESFTEAQHQLLATNCHDLGAGLIMLGGRDSFGAGGWMNTPVEKALPVDMQIKALKVQGVGAMALIMHATEMAEGNYWQKVVAKSAINALSNYDYVGLAHFEGTEAWLFPMRSIGSGRSSMLRLIDRMTPGDMPAFDPLLQMASEASTASRTP